MDWYDLLFTGRPSQRWLCYFLVFSSPLDRTGMKLLCERLQIKEHDRHVLIDQRSQGLATLRQLERRKPESSPPRNSTLYRWFQPLSTEVLLMMMAHTQKENVRRWISRYITQLRELETHLNGKDLERMGFKPGPIFRIILDDLRVACLDSRLETAEDEKRYVTRKYSKHMSSKK